MIFRNEWQNNSVIKTYVHCDIDQEKSEKSGNIAGQLCFLHRISLLVPMFPLFGISLYSVIRVEKFRVEVHPTILITDEDLQK